MMRVKKEQKKELSEWFPDNSNNKNRPEVTDSKRLGFLMNTYKNVYLESDAFKALSHLVNSPFNMFGKEGSQQKRKGMFGQKRGEIQNLVMAGIGIFFLAIIVVIMSFAFNSVDVGLNSSMLATQPAAVAASHQIISSFPSYFDNAMLFILFGLFFATLATSAIILMHPLLAVLYGVVLIIITIVMAVLSNAYQDFAATASLSATAASYPITGAIMGWLPFIIFFFGIICMAVMFKLRSVMQA